MSNGFFFPSSTADLLSLDGELSSITHRLKEISGSSRNCWWRAAWVAIFAHFGQKGDGEQLFKAQLSTALGPASTASSSSKLPAAIATVEAMLSAVKAAGIEVIFTQTEAARQSGEEGCREEPSNLCLTTATAATTSQLGAEESCQLLTDELLRLAGISEEVRLQVVYACELGDDVHLEILCRAFAVDLCIFSQPWTWSPTTGRALDEKATYLRVLASFNSSAFVLASQIEDDRLLCSTMLSNALEKHCIMVHHTAHFNVYIPDCLFHRTRGQFGPTTTASERDAIVLTDDDDDVSDSLPGVAGELESMGFKREHVQLALQVSESSNLEDLIDCLSRLDLNG